MRWGRQNGIRSGDSTAAESTGLGIRLRRDSGVCDNQLRRAEFSARINRRADAQRGGREAGESRLAIFSWNRRTEVEQFHAQRESRAGKREGHRGAQEWALRASLELAAGARNLHTLTLCLRHNGNSSFSISRRRSAAMLVPCRPGLAALLARLCCGCALALYTGRGLGQNMSSASSSASSPRRAPP
jgi:hypothetical protein